MKNRFIIKGKRGIIGSALTNFWSIIIFVIVVIIFFALFSTQTLKDIENKIISLDTQASKDITALNYLRTPIVTAEGEEKIFADFIVEALREPLLKNDRMNFFEETDEIVKKYLPGLKLPSNKLLILTEGNTKCWYGSVGRCFYDKPLRPVPPNERGVLLPTLLPNQGSEFFIEVSMDYK